jgi:hypothetical protein|tara:strand:- start:230 stop:766 length:537 start_codon:yes stop_codon:yes gene_type:complete
MKLKEFKERLILGLVNPTQPLLFKLEDGTIIPPYFHITEMGLKMKHFVDCGGTVRTEQWITFQIWTADDFDHRLTPQQLIELIHKNEGLFKQPELEVEMEYQTNTIGSYSLNIDPTNSLTYILNSKKTNCLAPDKCGITQDRKTDHKKQETFLSGYDMENVRKNPNQPATRQCGPSCC